MELGPNKPYNIVLRDPETGGNYINIAVLIKNIDILIYSLSRNTFTIIVFIIYTFY